MADAAAAEIEIPPGERPWGQTCEGALHAPGHGKAVQQPRSDSVFRQGHLQEEKKNLPFLRDHVIFHLEGHDQQSDFQYTLDLILDGLERDFADATRNL